MWCFQYASPRAFLGPGGRAGISLAPIPACKEDFSRIKLTSFDKLIAKTCSSIKNVRLCSEPDQRPGGSSGTSGVAPDAAYVSHKRGYFVNNFGYFLFRCRLRLSH